MSLLPGYRTPLSDASSMISARLSMFEDAPDSPDSWRFEASLVKPLHTASLEERLQACTITTTHNDNPHQAHEPRTMRFPALPEVPLPIRVTMGKKTIASMPAPRAIIARPMVQRGHGIMRATSFLDLSKPQHSPVKRSILTSAVHRVPSGRMPMPMPLVENAKERLKIKVMCPDEDEILAIKIHKDKLRSVRELADVVSIKLNIRYCMRPDDLECRLIFPNKSLPPVDLGAGDVGGLLEDFIMEYIQTRLKIYIEARLKPDCKDASKVTFTEKHVSAKV